MIQKNIKNFFRKDITIIHILAIFVFLAGCINNQTIVSTIKCEKPSKPGFISIEVVGLPEVILVTDNSEINVEFSLIIDSEIISSQPDKTLDIYLKPNIGSVTHTSINLENAEYLGDESLYPYTTETIFSYLFDPKNLKYFKSFDLYVDYSIDLQDTYTVSICLSSDYDNSLCKGFSYLTCYNPLPVYIEDVSVSYTGAHLFTVSLSFSSVRNCAEKITINNYELLLPDGSTISDDSDGIYCNIPAGSELNIDKDKIICYINTKDLGLSDEDIKYGKIFSINLDISYRCSVEDELLATYTIEYIGT